MDELLEKAGIEFEGGKVTVEDFEIKVTRVANYDVGNGIEATAIVDGVKREFYLQLPDIGDSQHSELVYGDKEHLSEDIVDKVIAKVVELTEATFESDLEICALNYNFDLSECEVEHIDSDTVKLTKPCGDSIKLYRNCYSDYYNRGLWDNSDYGWD